jgi:hypothetical protein
MTDDLTVADTCCRVLSSFPSNDTVQKSSRPCPIWYGNASVSIEES